MEKIPQKKSQKSIFLLVFLSMGMMIYALILPKETAETIRNATSLFAKTILPALFAFSVPAKILVKSGAFEKLKYTPLRVLFPFLGLSASGFSALCIGFLSGFPTGAAVLADSVKMGVMSKREAEMLLPFCNNAGAAFVVGVVGIGVFDSAKIGALLFSAQLLASLLAVVLTESQRKSSLDLKATMPKEKISAASVFTSSVSESALAMVAICGYIVFFSVLSGVFSRLFLHFFPSMTGVCMLFSGFLELSGGIAMLAKDNASFFIKLLFCSGFLGFGGLSVFCQVADYAEKAELSLSFYPKGKFMTMLFSTGFSFLFCCHSEKSFGIWMIFSCLFLIFCINGIKNKIFFKKSMEKRKEMIYNKNKTYYP